MFNNREESENNETQAADLTNSLVKRQKSSISKKYRIHSSIISLDADKSLAVLKPLNNDKYLNKIDW